MELFLKKAASGSDKRRFHVIIAEAEPACTGVKLANSLAKVASISVTLIPDSNIYAVVGRANKVIIAPHAVMMDGGCLCASGHEMVAIAAKHHAIPVVCVAGLYVMTPLFIHTQHQAREQLLPPSQIIDYSASVNFDNVEIAVPAFDYVSPDLIDLFVTNNGSHQPSYIYRLMSELYHPHDYTLL